MGDAVGLASIGMAVVGIAVIIASVAVLVMGVTLGARYAAASAPPNLDELRLGQILLGAALLAVGVVLLAIVVAVFRDVHAARWMGGAANGLLAVACLLGVAWLLTRGPQPDAVLAVTLALLAAFFAGAMTAFVVRYRLLPIRRG
jgi:hypothetical protein